MPGNFSCKARDPRNPESGWIEAIIPRDLAERAYKVNLVQYYNLVTAKFVLENVERIFRGVREYNDGGWCYTARPASWYIKEAVTAPFQDHLIYAVYLNPNLRVYEWRAEFADKDDPACPRDWRDRYGGLVWINIS